MLHARRFSRSPSRLRLPLSLSLSLAASLSLAEVLLASPAAAGGNEAPEYSPLPPPPPPPGEPLMRPIAPRPLAPPPAAPGRGTPPAQPASTGSSAAPASAASPGAPTTTTSASYGGAADPDAAPSGASHPPSLDDERLSIAPLLGYASDGLDLGVGVRAGKTVADHLWVGGTGMYHAGTSTAGVVGSVRYASSTSAFFVGGEVGYDFELGPVVLRPYGGLGLAGLTATASSSVGPGASQTATKLVIWPGATLLYGVRGSRFFVGGDTRLITIPGGPAFGLYAVGGLTL